MGNFLSGGASVSFNPDDNIPSLKGKVIFVTGGTSGLGKESILQLAKHNPSAICLGARNLNKARETIKEIQKQVPNAPIQPVEIDLASFSSIAAGAEAFKKDHSRLDILMLNGGVMMPPAATTKDGYEIQFGTNHMGHALLTKLLLPTLLSTAEKPDSDVRVVVLSSGAHNVAPSEGIVWDTLKTKGEGMSAGAKYGQSKLANILFAKELAKRYPQLTVSSIHPGIVNTNLTSPASNNSLFWKITMKVVYSLIGLDVAKGTLNQLWASVAETVKSGEYYQPVGIAGKGSKLTENVTLAEGLWKWTEEEIKNY
ncbi:putative oxidoreductase like protein [Verticillium longisporum]|uniref:Retinol dehydrogenase n=2 Tax=Verticillium TaxID=1036719 RepID=A0A2J8E0B9_VERDA|nr:hypothetical protein VdG2_07805 [Verticillium dahliae VDG2]KAF3354153.1 hypothetical protein VdG1_07618 [Verticillium dahliae VDG1]KAG7135146.1 putative oxidoreductase like protein [Verticillium longisporum]PNH33681.1 hypothetical protein BJF96_g3222 [Verticillium dahliae]PNH37744.1 hypothetical protein VD0004_g9047 [Verticillium dahliae]